MSEQSSQKRWFFRNTLSGGAVFIGKRRLQGETPIYWNKALEKLYLDMHCPRTRKRIGVLHFLFFEAQLACFPYFKYVVARKHMITFSRHNATRNGILSWCSLGFLVQNTQRPTDQSKNSNSGARLQRLLRVLKRLLRVWRETPKTRCTTNQCTGKERHYNSLSQKKI